MSVSRVDSAPLAHYSDVVRVAQPKEQTVTITLATVNVNGREYAAGGDPGGSMRASWRQACYVAANGRCAVCDKATRLDAPATADDRAEAGHILPGMGRGGYQIGNLILMCRECNLAAGEMDLRPFLPLFTNPNAIVMVKPSTTNVIGNTITNSAAIRKGLGLPF